MGIGQEPRRTQALRAPAEGSYTPAQSMAASNPCLNCGTNVQLEYCPECGQRASDTDPTLREYLQELAEEFLHWDGKVVRTFTALIARPGKLTREYLNGRRVRYISPLRVYLACSVLFFFVDAMVPPRIMIDRAGHPVEAGVVQVGSSTEQELAAIRAEASRSSPAKRAFLTHLSRALATPRELQHATTASIPRGMFLLVPFFAGLLGLVYRDRRRRFPQHLAFALHLHAALFLALAFLAVTSPIRVVIPGWMVAVPVFLLVAVHAVTAARLVYEGSTGQAARRMLLAGAMYFVAFVGVLAGVFAATVMTY